MGAHCQTTREITLRDSAGNSSSGTGSYPTFSDRLVDAAETFVVNGSETIISAYVCFAYGLKSDNNSDAVYVKPKITINSNTVFGTERTNSTNVKTMYYEEIAIPLEDVINSIVTVAISASTTGGDYTAYLGRIYLKIRSTT